MRHVDGGCVTLQQCVFLFTHRGRPSFIDNHQPADKLVLSISTGHKPIKENIFRIIDKMEILQYATHVP